MPHHFDSNDGAYPFSGLVESTGGLYGLTENFGLYGWGTFYRIKMR